MASGGQAPDLEVSLRGRAVLIDYMWQYPPYFWLGYDADLEAQTKETLEWLAQQ